MMKRLKELRLAKHLTQQRLSIELEIDQASISSYERGKYFPTVEVLMKMAEYFNTSTDYLLELSDIRSPLKTSVDDQAMYLLMLFKALPREYRERVIGYLEALQGK